MIIKRTTSSPNNDVAIAVAGENVAVLVEGDAGDVSGLIPILEDAHTFVQHTTIVQGPERHVSFSAGDDLISFQRMPFGANHHVDGALQSSAVIDR